MTFTYAAKPESICNVSEYNGVGPAVKTNTLNCFNSNQYARGKLDHVNGKFVGYKWKNIIMSEMY